MRWKTSTRPPGKPGNTRLTKHFWLGFLSRDLRYQTLMVNYTQAYLEILVKPGSTRVSLLVDNCQKPGMSGSTRVYQAHQAFNQTFGARVTLIVSYSLCAIAFMFSFPLFLFSFGWLVGCCFFYCLLLSLNHLQGHFLNHFMKYIKCR